MKYTVAWDEGYHIMKNGEKFLSLVDDPEDLADAEYVCDLLNNAQQSVQRMGLLARIGQWFGTIAHR